jgi:hypothetical protein
MTAPRLLRREWLSGALAVVFVETSLAGSRRARADATPDPGLGGVSRPPLARFTTTYETEGEHRPRAFNVELAADAIDGSVLPPGGVFSFNDTVGERTAAYGYQKSVVLRRHMLAEGTGGGPCQVASTLHAAALLAGLDVVERTAHSRPSAYIRMGLDATVVFPTVDLKLRNPRADRVVLRARAERGTLTAWAVADGPSRPHVTLTSEIVERIPYPRALERDASMPDDEVHVRAYGIPGYRTLRTRDIAWEERTRRDVRTDVYPPIPDVLVANLSVVARLELDGGRVTSATLKDEAGVRKPALVQLRPTTRIVLDNAPPEGS